MAGMWQTAAPLDTRSKRATATRGERVLRKRRTRKPTSSTPKAQSYEEIGEITGLPPGTVKSRIHRARGQLKELVEKELGEKSG